MALSSATPSPCVAASSDICARSNAPRSGPGARLSVNASNQSDHCTTLTLLWISGTVEQMLEALQPMLADEGGARQRHDALLEQRLDHAGRATAARRSGCRCRPARARSRCGVCAAERFSEISGYACAKLAQPRHQPQARDAGRRVHVEAVADALPQVVGRRADRRQRAADTRQVLLARQRSARTPCALRSNRRTPSCDSSRATWWLIADAVRCSSAAASAKLRRRATASKASRLASGGNEGHRVTPGTCR